MKTVEKVIYASDLDRTLIFSHRFLKDNTYNKEVVLVEENKGKEISYMSKLAYDTLQVLNANKRIHFVPVTTRSTEEYNRVKLGFIPEYAIVANGGVILNNGKPIEEYTKYVRTYLDPLEIATLSMDLTELESVSGKPRLVDSCYLFMKTDNGELFDTEIYEITQQYKKWQFIRQRNKCYAVPNHISKQVALRWLWHELSKPYIVASGDTLFDVPMLALADKALIPSHSELIKDGIVKDGEIIDGGVESPYKTMVYVQNVLSNE